MSLFRFDSKNLSYNLTVIEVMLHALDFLIVFMALAGYEDDVALLSQHTSRLDGFLAINDAYHLLHLLRCQTSQHVVDDVLWFFETWIVGGDDDAVALLDSFLSHERTLAFVAVAACTANGDDLAALAFQYFMNGIQHILQSIMGCGRSRQWR